MLQIKAQKIEISKIIPILAQYNAKASINQTQITIFENLSEEMIRKIVENVNVEIIKNFHMELATPNKLIEEKDTDTERKFESTTEEDYSLIEVKRGDVYWAELPDTGDHVIHGRRPVIVLSNDWVGKNGQNITVIPCTTSIKKLPTTKVFKFSPDYIDIVAKDFIVAPNTCALVEQICTIDKMRLKKHIGISKEELMKELEPIVVDTLGLNTDKKIPMDIKETSKTNELDLAQIKLLAFVDVEKLVKVLENVDTRETKIKKCLELFGFDLNKMGVQYLEKAILKSIEFRDEYFNLNILSQKIAFESEGISKEEIKSLIVPKVKQRFGFRNSPTMEFIKLIKKLIEKCENK